jgi:two-component system invasion response regulator UvrY
VTAILVADDHAVVRRGLIQLLTDGLPHARFGEAGTAAEAVAAARAGEWDLLVLDISLPGRSGLDALKDVKSARPKLPVLILSMHPEEQFAVRALRAGAAGYLTKQTAPEELLAAVRKVLRGGRYVSASLAERLASEIGGEGGKEPHETLSDREFQVLRLIASGLTLTAIAAKLSISVQTVSTYRARLLEKMGMATNADLTKYAHLHGLIE